MMRRAKTQLFSRRHQQSQLHQHQSTTQSFARSPLPIDDPHHDHAPDDPTPVPPSSHHHANDHDPHIYPAPPPPHAHHHGDTNQNHHHIQHQHHKSKRERDDSRAVFDGSRSRLGLSMGFKGFLSGSVSRKSHNQQHQHHSSSINFGGGGGGNTSSHPPPSQPPLHASSNTVADGGRTGPMHNDEFDPVRNEHASLGDLAGSGGTAGGGGGSGSPDGGGAGGGTTSTKERRKGGIHSSSQIAVDFFKWGKKRRQVFGTRAGGSGLGMNTHHPNPNNSQNHNHFQTTHDPYGGDDPHGLLYPPSSPHGSASATAHLLRNSLVSTDAPPLRYSNSNLCIAGWLSKRGKRLGSRVDRFFQLNGSILSNSRSETSRPTWFVNVRGSKVLSGPGKQIIFKVNKTFTSFYAPTDELHNRWMRALQAVCGNVTDFYDFGKLIGRGAYSEVFIARDKQRNELCAVKVLERSNGEHAKLIDRELAVLRMLNHANIVQIYDIFDSARETYVVMEYLAGGELLDLITESDHLSERNSKHVIREVLQAIQYLHARGIVHRDVKPENILCVNRAWPLRVKLTDFGLSKMVGLPSSDGTERVMRSQCGTAYYLAPEIANNTPYSKPVDLWACGVVLYVMLAGKFPFYGDTDEKFMRRLRAGVKFPDKEWAAVSSDAKSLVRGLLDPKPESRLTAIQALQHRWLSDDSMADVDVTSSSVPSVAAQRSHHRQRVQYDAITEPLSLQLAEFAGGRGHGKDGGSSGGGGSGSRSGGEKGGEERGKEREEEDSGVGKQQEQNRVAPHDEFGESEAHLLRTDHHPYGGIGGASHLQHHYNQRAHAGSTISGNTTPQQQQQQQQRHHQNSNDDDDVNCAQPQPQQQQQPFHYHHVAATTPSESAPDLKLKRAAGVLGERDDLDLSLGGRAGQSDVLGGYKNNFSGVGGYGMGMMGGSEGDEGHHMHHHHHQQRDRSLTMSVIMDHHVGIGGSGEAGDVGLSVADADECHHHHRLVAEV